MNCRECVEHLYEFLDRELTPDVEREIREHLEDCPPCGEQFDFEELFLRFRRRALGSTPRSQESQKQLLEIELLAAGGAVLQMFPDLALDVWRQLAIQEFIEVLDALTAIHAGLPL